MGAEKVGVLKAFQSHVFEIVPDLLLPTPCPVELLVPLTVHQPLGTVIPYLHEKPVPELGVDETLAYAYLVGGARRVTGAFPCENFPVPDLSSPPFVALKGANPILTPSPGVYIQRAGCMYGRGRGRPPLFRARRGGFIMFINRDGLAGGGRE